MGMYNAIFGQASDADELLGLLGLKRDDFYRYRDAYKDVDGLIAVYTRGGASNHECWSDECGETTHRPECVVALQTANRCHPLYANDADDDFDCTYCTFYFRAPTDADLSHIDASLPANDRWQIFIENLRQGASQ